MLTGSNGFDGHGCYVTLWDARKAEKVLDMQGHTQRVTSACFLQAPDMKLASGPPTSEFLVFVYFVNSRGR